MDTVRHTLELSSSSWGIDVDDDDDDVMDGSNADIEYIEMNKRPSDEESTNSSSASTLCRSFVVERASINSSSALFSYSNVDVIAAINHSCSYIEGNSTGSTGPWSPQLTSVDASPNAVDYEYEMPRFDEMSLVKTVVLLVMFVVALAGNTATLVRMFHMRRRRSTINLLITHLATADLIVTFFCNVTDAVWTSTVQWYAGNAACKILKYLQVFGLYLSTYVVVIISLDRCLAILDPISKNRAPRRVRLLLGVAWVLSALFSVPQTYIFRVERAPFAEEFQQCVTYGAYTAQWQEQLYSSLSVLLMYVIPLVTMVTAYLLIFWTIARKSRDFQAADNVEMLSHGGTEVRSRLFCKAKVKSLRMTTLIVVAFIVCWTPYQVMFIVHTFVDMTYLDNSYVMWIFFFGMANSMVNPLIYGAFHCSCCAPTVVTSCRPRAVDRQADDVNKTHPRVRQAREQHHLRTPSPSESTTSRNANGRGGHTLAGVKVRVGNCLSRATDDRGQPAAGPSCGLPGDGVAIKSTTVINGTGSVVLIDVDECRQCLSGLEQPGGQPPVVTRRQTSQLTSNVVPYGARPHPGTSCSFPVALTTASQTTPKVDSATERSRCRSRHHLFQQNRTQRHHHHHQQQQRSVRIELLQLCEYDDVITLIRSSIEKRTSGINLLSLNERTPIDDTSGSTF